MCNHLLGSCLFRTHNTIIIKCYFLYFINVLLFTLLFTFYFSLCARLLWSNKAIFRSVNVIYPLCGSLNSVGDIGFTIWQISKADSVRMKRVWLEIMVCVCVMTMTKPADSWAPCTDEVVCVREVNTNLNICGSRKWVHTHSSLVLRMSESITCDFPLRLSEVCAHGLSEISETRGLLCTCSLKTSVSLFVTHTHAY